MSRRSALDAFLEDGDDSDQEMEVTTQDEEEDIEEIVTPAASAATAAGSPPAKAASSSHSHSTGASSSSTRRRTHGSSSAHPSAASLHPSDAVRLTQAHAMLLVLDLPRGYQFGVDYWSFVSGAQFKGMKMVPAGVHYIWTAPGRAASGEQQMIDPDMAPRDGCFVWLDADSVWVRRWDGSLETLASFEDADEEGRYAAGARRFDFDKGQGSYPLLEAEKWTVLTDFMTKEIVEKLEPVDKMIGPLSVHKYTLADKQPKPPTNESEEKKDEGDTTMSDDAQVKSPTVTDAPPAAAAASTSASTSSSTSSSAPSKSKPASNLTRSSSTSFYTRIPTVASLIASQHMSADVSTRTSLVTAMHLDQSPLLEYVLQRTLCSSSTTAATSGSGDVSNLTPAEHALLGEYQFAFVAFLIGQDYEGFDQWKRLTLLLTSCGDAMMAHHALYAAWIAVLAAQLECVPKDFFVDMLSGENFMRPALQRLFDHAADAIVPTSLVYAMRELRERMRVKFMWRLNQMPTFKHREEVLEETAKGRSTNAAGGPQNDHEAIRALQRRLQAEAEEDEYAPTIVE